MSFNQPVAIVSAPGETNRLFVVERAGVICVITNLAAPNRTVFLDLRESTHSENIETGLLGLAFHPNFQTNGQFFVFRTTNDRNLADRLSRFEVSANDANRANTNETILINQLDLSETHNAGDLHFGPDGYLYISVGDEGPLLPDRGALPQAIDGGLFGGILRIDVDQRPGNLSPSAHPSVVGNYSIPSDNPFIGATTFLGEPVDPGRVRTEFFAVGMRNPWRFTVDPQTGDVLVGDVGLAWAEEINLVTAGGNYGWPFWEGVYPRYVTEPPDFEPQWPLYEIERGNSVNLGSCVIGGIVCRKASVADLEGWYVFGDEGSGNIWKLRVDEPENVQWVAREPGIVAFGRDPATGDVLAANLTRGEIRRLVYAAPEEERIPTKLSATGIFTSLENLTPRPGVTPYEINVPFWSDNAIKKRWFGLMNGESKIRFSPIENWQFPEGAVWVKHFELEMERGNPASARRVETRLLIKWRDQVHGFTYLWDDAGREANLVGSIGAQKQFAIKDPDGQIRTQTWIFPPRGDCAACHSKGGGGPLAFNTAQLNLDHNSQAGSAENQLVELLNAGYLQTETAGQIVPRNLPALAKAADTTQPLEFRVKSYLSANCSQCHRPDGVWSALWDARWTTPMSEQRIVGAAALAVDDTDNWKIIAPHSLEASAMFHRLTEPDIFRMPPIGSTLVNESVRDLFREWILGMPDEVFKEIEVGGGTLTGSATQKGSTRIVSGIGQGMSGGAEDHFHFLALGVKRSGYVTAHLGAAPGSGPGMRAGVMIRESGAPNAAGMWLARQASGQNTFVGRSRIGNSAATIAEGAAQSRSWMRLIRNGDFVSAWESEDGVAWQKVGESECRIDADALAGVAVASGENWRFATAEFDKVQTLSVSFELNDPAANTPLPRDLVLQADVQTNGVAVSRVDFVAGGQVIASVAAPPWRFVWTNAWSGDYDVTAIAVDQNGFSMSSEPQRLRLIADPPVADFAGSTGVETNWVSAFGRFGEVIPGVITNLPSRVTVNFAGGEVQRYSAAGFLRDDQGVIPATGWISENELFFKYDPGNEIPHRLTMFFAGYGSTESMTVTCEDGSSGAILSQQIVSNFESGRFVSWAVRGAIDIRIRPNGAGPGVLNGIFLDPLSPPTVRLSSIASPVVLPASILLTAEASAEGRQVRRVEFWDGDRKIGEKSEEPFEIAWTGALAGEHAFTAVAIGEYGLSARSDVVKTLCTLPPIRVTFLSEDRVTQGDWIGSYGAAGQVTATGWTNLESKFELNIQSMLFNFSSFETNRFSLQRPDADDRFAGCYFVNTTDSMEIRIRTADGRAARVGLYFLDWFGPGRKEELTVLDGATGAELDRRVIESFSDGVYLNWNIQGDLRFMIRSLNDFNTVVSAVFFDPVAPEVSVVEPTDNSTVVLPTAIALRASVITNEMTVNRVEFFADQQRIASVTNEPYEFVWTNALAGDHKVFARVIAPPVHADSKPITVHLGLPAARAVFAGQNGLIKGNWWKSFGADGFKIPLGPDEQRPFARILFDGFVGLHQWLPPGDDERGVYLPDEKLYDAACFYADVTFDATIELLDGREHLVAFYFVDFERVGAMQLLQVLDDSKTVLDERLIDDMGEGLYLAWNAQGPVHFHIIRLTDWAAILSGIFVGGPIADSQFWWARHFGGDLLAVPKWNDDPDADGRPNFVEYAIGSDPFVVDSPLVIGASLDGRSVTIDLNGATFSSAETISAEVSADLVNWRPATLTRSNGDGTMRFAVPATEGGPHFYRLRFEPPN